MKQETWKAVDHYFEAALGPPDPVLEAVLERSQAAGLPAHQVAANQGRLLMLLGQMSHAKRILEVGTLGGYSTIWLARALPADGQIITLELNPTYAEIARENYAGAGVAHLIQIQVGPALDSLAALQAGTTAPFDMVFIDADKQNNTAYFEAALALSRPGTVIVIDNVVRGGAVVDANSDDPRVWGVRQVVERLATEPRVRASALQTVGEKGYDGFILAVVQTEQPSGQEQ